MKPTVSPSAGPGLLQHTEEAEAAEWDLFLESSPLGHFQQTSRWARLKALDGWQAERFFLQPAHCREGGLQLLWKASRFGRIGYVSKGPVLAVENEISINLILEKLIATARALSLRALILQPPDHSRITNLDLQHHQFGAKPVANVIRATATIDVGVGRSVYEDRIHHKTRREARAAVKRGVVVRPGNRTDLGRFFALMCDSCRRQNTQPNPSRLEALEKLWDVFAPNILLGFATVQGEDIAGLLMLAHGPRLTFWKKGWNAQGSQFFANCLLMVEAMNWAQERGFTAVDFAGLDRDIAEALLAGRELSAEQQSSRDKFNLRLGAEPQLLPPAQLLVINPVLRALLQTARRYQPLDKFLMKRLGAG